MSDSSSGSNNNSHEGLHQSGILPITDTNTTTTTLNNSKAIPVPDEVKMSFRSLSNEITIYEIKTGPNPEVMKGNSNNRNNFRASFNHFELPDELSCNIIEQGDDDDEDNDDETRMDAALMLETELVEDDPMEEEVVIQTTTATSPNYHHLINNCPQIGGLGLRGRRSPTLKIIPVVTPNPVKIQSVSLSTSTTTTTTTITSSPSPSVPDVETTTTTTVDSKEMDIKVVSMGGVGNTKSIKIPTRRKKRKRVFTPSRIATSIHYRTRTVVKAATLAAQNQLATETAEKHKKALSTPQIPQQSFHSRSPASPKAKTMKEVLASIPGFGGGAGGRPRKRHYRKLSTAAQLEQTKKEGLIDLETPGSILTQVNLKSILNKHTFYLLPPLYQYKLLQLLPEVDGVTGSDPAIKLSNTALTNEFFTKSCQEWTEKLSAGELTVDQRQRNKQEAERERLKLDPWKVKHFEPIWGMKGTASSSKSPSKSSTSATITKPSRTLTPPPPIHGHSLRRSPARQILRISPRFDSQNFVSERNLSLSRSSPPTLSNKTLGVSVSVRRKREELIIDDDDDEDDDDDIDDEDYEVSDEEDSDYEPIIPSSVRRLDRHIDSKTILSSSKSNPNSNILLTTTTTNSPSPSNKRPARNDNDKPPVLVKKIKIIPPMPPSGKQVAFNMEVKVEEIQPATPVLTPSTDPDVEGDMIELMDEDIDEQVVVTSENLEERTEVVPPVTSDASDNVVFDSTQSKDSSIPVSPSTSVSVPDKSLHSSSTNLPSSKSQVPPGGVVVVSTSSSSSSAVSPTGSPVKSLSSKSFNSIHPTLQSLNSVVQQQLPVVTTCTSPSSSSKPIVSATSTPSISSPTKEKEQIPSCQSSTDNLDTKEAIETTISSDVTLSITVIDNTTEQQNSTPESLPTTATTVESVCEKSLLPQEEILSSSNNILTEKTDVLPAVATTTITDSITDGVEKSLLSNNEAVILVVTEKEKETISQVETVAGRKLDDEKNMSSSLSQIQKVTTNSPTSKSSSNSNSNTEQKTVENDPPLVKASMISVTPISVGQPLKCTTTLSNISSTQRTTITTSTTSTTATTTTTTNSVSTSVPTTSEIKVKGSAPPVVNCPAKPTGVQVTNKPTSVQVTNKPTSVQVTNKPTSVQVTNKPTSVQVTNKPTSVQTTGKQTGMQTTSKPMIKLTNDPGVPTSKNIGGKVTNKAVSESVSKSESLPSKINKTAVSTLSSSASPATAQVQSSKSVSLVVGSTQSHKVKVSSENSSPCTSNTTTTTSNTTTLPQNSVSKKISTPTQVLLVKAKEGDQISLSAGKVASVVSSTKTKVKVSPDTVGHVGTIVKDTQVNPNDSTKNKSTNEQAKKTNLGDSSCLKGKPSIDTQVNSVKIQGIMVKKENKDCGKLISTTGVVQETVKVNLNPPPLPSTYSKTVVPKSSVEEKVLQQQSLNDVDDDCVIVNIEQKESSVSHPKTSATTKLINSEGLGLENRLNQQKKDDSQLSQQQQQQKREILKGKQIVKESPSVEDKKRMIVGQQQKKEGLTGSQVNTTNQQPAPTKENQKRQIPTGHELSGTVTTKMTALSPAQVAIAKATNQLAKNPDVTLKPLIQPLIKPSQVPTTTTKIGTQLQAVKSVQLQIRPVSATSSVADQMKTQITQMPVLKVDSTSSNTTTTTSSLSGPIITVKGGGNQLTGQQTIRSQPVYIKMVPVPLTATDNSTTMQQQQVEGGKITIPFSSTSTTTSLTKTISIPTAEGSTTTLHTQNPQSILLKVTSGVGNGGGTTVSTTPIPMTIATSTIATNVAATVVSSSSSSSGQVSGVLTPVVTGSPVVAGSTATGVNNDKVASKNIINVVVSNQSQANLQNAQQAKLKMPRTSSVPPGSINLERSYQICQAVIQNSPNREQLQNQLVKPPPAPPIKIDAAKILQHQQFNQQQSLQGHQIVTNDSALIQVQRRSTTPTIIHQAPLQTTSVLSGMQPHQKVIVALSPAGGNGPMTITQHHLQSPHVQQQQHGGGTTTSSTLIRPGSPIVVHHLGTQRPQLVVSSGTSSSSVGTCALTNTVANNLNLCSNVTSNTVPVSLMHMGVGVGHGNSNHNHGSQNNKFPQIHQPTLQAMQMQMPIQAASSHSANNNVNVNSSINLSNSNNHVQTQSTSSTATATIITPQQLGMLIQQQQANQQRAQTMVPLSLPLSSVQNSVTLPFSTQTITTRPLSHPNSASSVQSVLSNNTGNNSSSSPVFIQSSGTNPSSPQPITVVSSSNNSGTGTSAIKIIRSNSFFHQPNARIHIPNSSQASQSQIQQRQQVNNSSSLRHGTPQTNSTFNLNSGCNNSNGFPVRAQIVTSNGETLTFHSHSIHRASSIPINSLTNGPIRLRPPYAFNINMAQVKRTGGSFVISSGTTNNSQDGNSVRSSPNPSPQQTFISSGIDHSQLTGQIQNQMSQLVNSIAVSTTPSNNTITMSRTGIMSVSQNPNNKNQMMRCPVRIISHPISHGNVVDFQTQNHNFSNVNTNVSLNNENSSSQQQQGSGNTTIINSVSNLADFITNQLAASNIRPISPLAFENGQRGNTVTVSGEGERSSPNVFSIQSQQPSQQQQQNFILSEIPDITNNSNQNQSVDQSSVVLVSVLNPPNTNMNTDANTTTTTTTTTNNGTTTLIRKINQLDKFPSDLINCTNDAVLDLQDAISVNVDSPYSLISEPDPPNIAEIIDVPTTIENIENVSSVSSSNSNSNSNLGTSSTTLFPNGSCSNSSGSLSNYNSIASPIWINSGSEHSNPSPGLIQIQDHSSSSSPLPPPSQTVHNVTNNNNNKRRLDVPVVVSEVDRNTLLAQSHQQQQQPIQQGNVVQRIDNSNSLTGRGSTEGVRQQQYIIVQTTGSNGLPTNLAVPASIMLSPQVLMDQHQNSGNIPISFAGQQGQIQSGNIVTMTPVSMAGGQNTITVQHHPVNTTGDNSGIKNVQLPMEIQDSSAVRVLYSGQNGSGSIQHVAINQLQQQQQQQQAFSQNRGSPLQYTQIPTQTLQQQIAAASQNAVQNHSNIVQVQASQAPTIVHQQAVNHQVLNVGNANFSSNPPNVVNLNLNGQGSSTVSRIITTQPGQHPVISIPDTTQNCGGSGSSDSLLGQEYDIFSAIAEGNVKVEGLVNRTNDRSNSNGALSVVNPELLGNVLSASINDSTGSNNNNRRTSSDFQGVVEEVGQIILDSGGNCVCDLRAMIMCRNCQAYCHAEHHPYHTRNCLKETV